MSVNATFPSAVTAAADPDRMHRLRLRIAYLVAIAATLAILVEMLRNAIKHTGKEFRLGGKADVRIAVAAAEEGAGLVWTVSNKARCVKAKFLSIGDRENRLKNPQSQPGGSRSWGSFIIMGVLQNQIPKGFPLRNAPTGFLPDRMFLTDRERWKTAP